MLSDSHSHRRSDFDSDDEDARSIGRKYGKDCHFSATGRDTRAFYSEKSNAERHMSDNSNRHSREKHGHHRRNSSKNCDERLEHYASDSSRKDHHHRDRKETSDNWKRAETDAKKHGGKHSSHSETGLEPSTSSDRKRQQKEKEPHQTSRNSRQIVKATDDDALKLDRWEMVDGSDREEREGYRYLKRKRNH